MRSYGQVQALSDLGCDVKVLSCADQGFEMNHDFDYHSLKNVIFKKVKNSSEQFVNIDLSKNSYRARIKKIILRLFPKFFLRIIFLFRTLIFLCRDDPKWTRKVLHDYKKDLGDWSPNLIFSTCSPVDSHIIASKISRDLSIPWVGEFRDCWSYNTMLFSTSENELSARILRAIERKILSNCSVIFAAGPSVQSYYARHFSKETQLLLGGWEERNSEIIGKFLQKANTEDTKKKYEKKKKIKVLHLGSMLHGTRSILPIIQMLDLEPLLKERYEFEFVGRDSKIFQSVLDESPANNAIKLFDHVTFNEAEKLGYSADILLILMKDSPMEKYTLTGKIFEYIKFSKPIISFDPYDSEVSKLIKKFNLGYHVKSINEFQLLLKSKTNLSDFAKADNHTRLEFQRSVQIKKVLKRLKDFA
ncbi:hypothetical protein N9M61_01365 [Gammaproteobacteria bacterium]|nr:hypothetical protein [Gammaproteobacteria bacterium]MDA8798624.1 hypothetical protein [Gammaproteobacteria bacterium]MDC0919310.1 hypothetical protein [Gammaproteobacteria bacterium]